MIIGTNGKQIKKKVAPLAANAVVMVSEDTQTWTPIPKGKVPIALLDEEAMGFMLAGEILSIGASGPYYMATKVSFLETKGEVAH